MKSVIAVALSICILATGCRPDSSLDKVESSLDAYGHWVTEPNGSVMLDPQTSGLIRWRGGLLTLSDRSADPSQRLRLRAIDTATAKLVGPDMPMELSKNVEQSCFAEYVSGNPDLEALVLDPDDDNVFYVVTEDATSAGPMSLDCQSKYQNTGSTDYPTLLIRLEIQTQNTVLMTHVRPIQFAPEMNIGNFPNEGIEALAFGKNRTLYLGIEKDANKNARIFSLAIDRNFWSSDAFAAVEEFELKLPTFSSGNHPINGMDYYQTPDGKEFLLVAARNDESLWVVDLNGEKNTKVIPINFFAEIKNSSTGCEKYEAMDNGSIEGVAVTGETLWLINDPWKAVYLNNIKCSQNRASYQKFAPLLFSVPIQAKWFD